MKIDFVIKHRRVRGAILIPVPTGLGWAWGFGVGAVDMGLRFESLAAAEAFRETWGLSPRMTAIGTIEAGRTETAPISTRQARARPLSWVRGLPRLVRYPGPVDSMN